MNKICEAKYITQKGFYVYQGLSKNTKTLQYVGTTTQKPADRFRWHKHNGKDLIFEIVAICKNQEEMLDLEWNLIKKYKPKLNKIKSRKQNFNKKLSNEDIEKRKGNDKWCQRCLKRRVNKGYEFCLYCS